MQPSISKIREFHCIAINASKKKYLIKMLKCLWDLMLPYAFAEEDRKLRSADRKGPDLSPRLSTPGDTTFQPHPSSSDCA